MNESIEEISAQNSDKPSEKQASSNDATNEDSSHDSESDAVEGVESSDVDEASNDDSDAGHSTEERGEALT